MQQVQGSLEVLLVLLQQQHGMISEEYHDLSL
jgi:hypothetical protein